jgi:hypothetical protein
VYPPVLAATSAAVKIREVRAISRKGREGADPGILRDHTPDPPVWRDDMVRPAWRHAERDRNDRAPTIRGSNNVNGPKVRNREPTLSVMAGDASGYMLGTLVNPAVLGE